MARYKEGDSCGYSSDMRRLMLRGERKLKKEENQERRRSKQPGLNLPLLETTAPAPVPPASDGKQILVYWRRKLMAAQNPEERRKLEQAILSLGILGRLTPEAIQGQIREELELILGLNPQSLWVTPRLLQPDHQAQHLISQSGLDYLPVLIASPHPLHPELVLKAYVIEDEQSFILATQTPGTDHCFWLSPSRCASGACLETLNSDRIYVDSQPQQNISLPFQRYLGLWVPQREASSDALFQAVLTAVVPPKT